MNGYNVDMIVKTANETTSEKGAKPIGLIGVGLIGTAIAQRLLATDFEVLGTDIQAENRLRFYRGFLI